MYKKFENFKGDIDPFNEEDWTEYDIFVDRPGFKAKHVKGGNRFEWRTEINIDVYFKFLKTKNPRLRDDEMDYYAGFGIGFTLSEEYYKKYPHNA